MKPVALSARVRHACHVEGLSQREAARHFGIEPKTVAKMLRHAVPPGYRRTGPPPRPKLDAVTGRIDQIPAADRSAPPKQRHTAKRIHDRRRAEPDFTGGHTIVKDDVRAQRARAREMFVPLAHPPGHARADFGEAVAVIGGERRKIHLFCLDRPHSDAGFVKAYPAERSEAFLDGHNAAFAFFGAAPRSLLSDTTKLAVARILGDGTRQRTRSFAELPSHALFPDRFGRPGKGNDQGQVEGLVGYARRNFLVPVPVVASFSPRSTRSSSGAASSGGTTGSAARPRPSASGWSGRPGRPAAPAARPLRRLRPPRATRVSALSLVRHDRNDDAVPTAYGHRPVLVKGHVDEVVIACGAEVIARHARS